MNRLIARLKGVSNGAITLNVQFGTKTRVGHGGFPLATYFTGIPAITSGNGAAHWDLDDTYSLVPKNGVNAFGTAPPSFTSTYNLVVSDGITSKLVNITMLNNVFHVAKKASGSNASVIQIEPVFSAANNFLALGDAVVLRNGDYNPTHLDIKLAPRAIYTGSGRITILSENTLGARFGRLSFDDNVSGNISWPIDIRGIDFRVNSTASAGGFTIVELQSGGGGHRFYNCNFEVDSGHSDPANFNGIELGRDSHIIDCTFRNTGQSIKLSNFPENNIITGNTFSKIYGDCVSGHFKNITFSNNFAYDKVFLTGSGAHTDFIQHLGVQVEYQIGTGDGTSKTFEFTLPGAPIIVSYALRFGSGSPTTCQINVGNYLVGPGIVSNTTDSPMNKTTGVGKITFTFTPAMGQPIYLYYGADNVGVDWIFGTVEDNIIVRNDGTPNNVDCQAYFFDDTYGPSRLINAVFRRNIGFITFGNGLFLSRFKDPVVEYNTLLVDVGASAGGTKASNTSILLLNGSGGSIKNNLANAYVYTGHTGATISPVSQAQITATELAYSTAFTNYSRSGLTTRMAVRAAFSPRIDGPAKNADGTYNGVYFPDGTPNTGAVYSDPNNTAGKLDFSTSTNSGLAMLIAPF